MRKQLNQLRLALTNFHLGLAKKYQSKNQTPLPASVWHNPIHFIACGFGTGALPGAPGTWGTVVGVIVFLILSPLPLWAYLVCLAVLTAGAIWISHETSKAVGISDHSGVNIDEIIGFLFTMIGLPASWQAIISGFILFRLFDILKPWPIRWIDEKIHGGFGMILDDIVAGIFAGILVHGFGFY